MPLATRPSGCVRCAAGKVKPVAVYSRHTSRRRVVVRNVSSEEDTDTQYAAGPKQVGTSLDDRISSGEFTDVGSTREKLTRPLRKAFAVDEVGLGRSVALYLAKLGRQWRSEAARKMPEARGDIREIVGQPVFVPLYKLFLMYGGVFRLSFGPRSFVVVSDPKVVKQILYTNAEKYSKGLLSEILDFVMGKGLIPADGEIWLKRRRAIVPALHKKYVASMVDMFGNCSLHGTKTLDKAVKEGKPVEMENFYSRLGLDIIGKAVFNYDFDSLTHDDPVIKAVYTALREAEYRSIAVVPYWNIPLLRYLVPRQRKCLEALKIINSTLDTLVEKCQQLVDEEDEEFKEDFLSERDPSILHFLLASGDEISSKQLRDDLMTLLIAGHETTAAVLTWTTYMLVQNPAAFQMIRQEVDEVLGDRKPTVADIRNLKYLARCINEGMRLYPQPPVLIRRAMEPDSFDGYTVESGTDIFISTWNLHRAPQLWQDPEEFRPERFGPLDGPGPNEINQNWSYLPFGGGRRKCIGDQFALFEAIVALAMLVRRYDFALAPNCPEVGMTTGATIHTVNGLWMNVTPRVMPATQQHTEEKQLAFASNGHSFTVHDHGSNRNGNGHVANGRSEAHVSNSHVKHGYASHSSNGSHAEGHYAGSNGDGNGYHVVSNGNGNGHYASANRNGNGYVTNGGSNGHVGNGNAATSNGHVEHADGNGLVASETMSEELTSV